MLFQMLLSLKTLERVSSSRSSSDKVNIRLCWRVSRWWCWNRLFVGFTFDGNARTRCNLASRQLTQSTNWSRRWNSIKKTGNWKGVLCSVVRPSPWPLTLSSFPLSYLSNTFTHMRRTGTKLSLWDLLNTCLIGWGSCQSTEMRVESAYHQRALGSRSQHSPDHDRDLCSERLRWLDPSFHHCVLDL